MKKLLILAVVVLGFTATSFAQQHLTKTSDASLGEVKLATKVSPNLTISNEAPLDFGIITNSANGGSVRMWPEGAFQTSGGVLTSSSKGTPATFKIIGSDQLPTITIGNQHQSIGGGTTFDIAPATDCYISPNGAYAGEYILKVGGTLTFAANAAGSLSAIVVSVTVNGQ